MSIVQALALAHASATVALLLLFVVLVCVQRLAASVRGGLSAGAAGADTPAAYPSTEERSAIPAQDAAEGTSVLEWRVDLRDDEGPAASRQLQRSS